MHRYFDELDWDRNMIYQPPPNNGMDDMCGHRRTRHTTWRWTTVMTSCARIHGTMQTIDFIGIVAYWAMHVEERGEEAYLLLELTEEEVVASP
jgi:hypothetical protein